MQGFLVVACLFVKGVIHRHDETCGRKLYEGQLQVVSELLVVC